MIYPEDERIRIANTDHSISVIRDVSTPTYSFPNPKNMAVEKSFLAAGMRGLGCVGCLGDAGTTWNMGDWLMVGLVAMFVVPHFIKGK